jgi:AraC-like DNA-binding protein
MSKPCPTTARLAELLRALPSPEGITPSRVPDVRLMRASSCYGFTPVCYDPCVVIIAQGRKRGRLGGRTFTYDPGHYLVLSVPLPFDCETLGTAKEPMLGLSVRVTPAIVAELLLEMNAAGLQGSPRAVDALPLTAPLVDAAERLAICLHSDADARILGPQIVREITYRALCGRQGAALQAIASPESALGRVARVLRRIHQDFAGPLDVSLLAREAGMSVSTFHASFKSVTALPPLRYLQTIRLHKAQVLLASGLPVAEAAHQVGYESPSQFSREFKRLFGGTPREVAVRAGASALSGRA